MVLLLRCKFGRKWVSLRTNARSVCGSFAALRKLRYCKYAAFFKVYIIEARSSFFAQTLLSRLVGSHSDASCEDVKTVGFCFSQLAGQYLTGTEYRKPKYVKTPTSTGPCER